MCIPIKGLCLSVGSRGADRRHGGSDAITLEWIVFLSTVYQLLVRTSGKHDTDKIISSGNITMSSGFHPFGGRVSKRFGDKVRRLRTVVGVWDLSRA
jgi:hypothetical protein